MSEREIIPTCDTKKTTATAPIHIGSNMQEFYSTFEKFSILSPNDDLEKSLGMTAAKIDKIENLFRKKVPMLNKPLTISNSYSTNKKYYKPTEVTEEMEQNLEVLKTLKIKEELQSKGVETYLKYRSNIWLPEMISTDKEQDLTPYKECVIKIRLYQPFIHEQGKRNWKFPKFANEVAILGSQTLATFVDSIRCPQNHCTGKDISQNPEEDTTPDPNAENSGFVYINDVFYNDFRRSSNVDLSMPIIQWAKSKSLDPKFTTGSVETTFNDITLRVGMPYVYQHKGYCEHVFLISNILVLGSSNSLVRADYPMIRSVSCGNAVYCMICNEFQAQKITQMNARLPSYKYYVWCNNCFYRFNYVDGKPIGDFTAHNFYQKFL